MKKLPLILLSFLGSITPLLAQPALSYSSTSVVEAATNDGYIDNSTPITATLTGDTFQGTNGDDFFATGFVYFENTPDGLTPVVTRQSPTQLQITFAGHATNHANAQDATNVVMHFYDRFTTSTAAQVANSSQAFSVNFNDSVLLAYDGFDYTSGTAVATSSTVGSNGGAGWAAPWRTNTLNGIWVGNTGLNYQKLLVGGKSALAMGTGTQGQLWRGIPGGFGGAGNTHWVAFLLTKNTNTTDAPIRFGLTDSATTPVIQAALIATPSSGLWASTATAGYTTTWRAGWNKAIAGGTSLVIMRIVVDTTTTISYWLNPADYTTVAGLGAADVTFTNPAALSYPYFQFYVRNATSLNAIAFDELRVGSSLPAVTPYDPNAPDLVLSKTGLAVHEADGVDTMDVSLIAAPSANVIIDASCADPSIATVSPAQLTFTTSNWATPQTITATALNDSVLRNRSTTLTLAVNPASAPAYAAMGNKQLALKLYNDDVLALVTEQTTVNITDGASADLRFKLSAQPPGSTLVTAALDPVLQPKSALKVLVVGNSYSAGFSPEFQSLIAADPTLSLTFGSAIFGGKTLTNHYDNRMALYYGGTKSLDGLLDEQAWDCVVLQEESVGPTSLTANGTATFLAAAKNLRAFITEKMSNGINDNPAVKIYYWMTPAHHENSSYMTGGYSPEGMQKEVREGYFLVANDPLCAGTVIPVGNAFERAYTQTGYDAITLHALPDTTHHSILGKYLGAAVMARSLYQRDLNTNTYVPAGMTQQDVDYLKGVAADVVQLGSSTAENADFGINGSTSFTFTPANWDTWQTITLQAAAGSAGRLSSANLRLHGDALVIDGFASLSSSLASSNYQGWLAANALPTDRTGSGAPNANPSGDGVVNSIKFALGLKVNDQGTSDHLQSDIVSDSGSSYLALTYTRPEPAPVGVSYAVMVGSDLVAWTDSQTAEVSSTVNAGLRTTTVRDTVEISPSSPCRFIRFEINLASLPSISSQPASTSFTIGSPVSLSVAGSGMTGSNYQWYRGTPPAGVAITGATSSTYTISSPQVGDGGSYYVVISHSAGAITSTPASLLTPPVISSQPLGAGFSLGSPISLSVAGNGFPSPDYQWYKGTPPAGVPIAGATSANFAIVSAQLGDAGEYYVVASNGAGSVTSTVGSLASVPSITTQPVSKGFTVGTTVSLSVVAAASPAPSYQWYQGTAPGGVPVTGATNATYTIASAQTGNSGNYYVVVANSAGSVTSSAATLTAGLPAITAQPVDVITSLGAEVRGLVVASGDATLTYQWYKGTPGSGVPISSAASASSRLSATASATISDAGKYYVIVSNGVGSVTSNTINVSFATLGGALDNPAQAVTTTSTSSGTSYARPWYVVSNAAHYGSASVRSGRLYDNTKSIMTTTVTGPVSLSFWWKVASTANVNFLSFYVDNILVDRISGTTDWAEKTHNITASGNHTLQWEIGGNVSIGWVDQFTMAGVSLAPIVSSQPASQTVASGTSAAFSVVATGTPTPTYQWYKGTGPSRAAIAGATGASYTIPNVQLSDAGAYSVTLTNTNGSATSSNATLTVFTPVAPTITTHPESQTVEAGASATLSVVATGSPAPTYHWLKGGVAIAGATGASYTIKSAQGSDSGDYSVTAANSAATVTSATASLLVTTPPIFTKQPASQSVGVGTVVTFSVDSTGSPAPTYQWAKGGVPIIGATSASYTLPSVQAGDEGGYTVTATNTFGIATSASAQLTIVVAGLPVITAQPAQKTVNYGTELKFGVSVTSDLAVTYQWYKEGVLLPGATKSFYLVASATQADAGSYHVIVTNSLGSVTSASAAMVVVAKFPTVTTQPASKSVYLGADASFSVVTAGIPEPTYTWYKVGVATPIAGANGATLTLPSVSAGSAGGYYAVLANAVGTATSATATLAVDDSLRLPRITSQPSGRQVFLGDSVTLSAVADANPPALTYQWTLNGTNISGATSASYTIPACGVQNLGDYAVVVTNSQGSITSDTASLSEFPAGTLRLTEGATARCVIVATTGLSPSEETAKTDLKKFLEQMSGAVIPILTPAQAAGSTQTKIILGQKTVLQMFPTQYPAGSFAGLGTDGFILKTIGDSLLVAGGEKRGTLYAAFDLLERLGCRWWAVGASSIPSKTLLAAVPLDENQVPALEYRDMLYGDRPNLSSEENGSQLYIHNKVNGFNYKTNPESLGGRFEFAGNLVHTWHSLMAPVVIDGVLVDGSYQAHPEYYAERAPGVYNSGQVNPLHPMVFKIMLANVRKQLTANPNYEFVVVGQEDNSNHCLCTECVAMATAQGTYNAPGLDLGNRIADVVAAEFPGKWVMVPAYTWSRTPPLTMRPRSNVGIVLCSIECDFNRPLGDASTPENLAFSNDIIAWGAIAPKLYIWDYTTNFNHYLAPFPNLDAIVPNIKWLVEHGVKGILEQGSSSTEGAEFAKLRMWVLARALWNGGNYADGGKGLITEFLEGYYGAAAPFIQQYIDLIHGPGRANPAMRASIYADFDVEWITPAIIAEAEEILRQAESAVEANPIHHTRVSHVHSAVWYVLLKQGTQSKTWAETVARVGALDVKDIAAKNAKVAVDNNLTQIAEGDGITPFVEWAADYAALAAVAPPLPAELQGLDPSTYRLIQACQLNERSAWWKRNPAATDGWVAQHPSVSWKISHQFSPYDEVTPGQRYKLFARLQTTSPVFDASTAVKLGIYRESGAGSFSKYVSALSLSDGQFHTFELGEFTAELDSGLFWMALNSSSSPPINLDCIWLQKIP